MFLATRPGQRTIERFLEESRVLPLSYEPIGAAQHEPRGYNVDETIVAIGHGPADFDRAKAALRGVDALRHRLGAGDSFGARTGAGHRGGRRDSSPRRLVGERLPHRLRRRRSRTRNEVRVSCTAR